MIVDMLFLPVSSKTLFLSTVVFPRVQDHGPRVYRHPDGSLKPQPPPADLHAVVSSRVNRAAAAGLGYALASMVLLVSLTSLSAAACMVVKETFPVCLQWLHLRTHES